MVKNKALNTSIPVSPLEGNASKDIAAQLQRQILSLYGEFLAEDGSAVDYVGIGKSEGFKEYKKTAALLQLIDLSTLSEDEKTAFFINVYNALHIHGVVEKGEARNLLQRLRFYKNTAYVIGGYTFSLNGIEHGILRGNKTAPGSLPFSGPQFRSTDPRASFVCKTPDPRIHFALNCGAQSCPPIRVFTPANVLTALDLAARAFCANEVELDEQSKTVTLSKIFDWYKGDFGSSKAERLRWIAEYLTDDSKATLLRMLQGSVRIKYRKYDWHLNSK